MRNYVRILLSSLLLWPTLSQGASQVKYFDDANGVAGWRFRYVPDDYVLDTFALDSITMFEDGVTKRELLQYQPHLKKGPDPYYEVLDEEDVGFRTHPDAVADKKIDCDLNRIGPFTQLYDLARIVTGETIQPVKDVNITAKNNLAGDIIKLRNGHGTVLLENNCYIVANTAYHVLTNKSVKEGQHRSVSPTSLDFFEKHSNPYRVDAPSKPLGKIIDIITIDSMGSTLEQNEENSFVIIEKEECQKLRASEKYDGLKEKRVFNFNNIEDFKNDALADKSGKAGIYMFCPQKDGSTIKTKQQRGSIGMFIFSDKDEGGDKQDLMVLNTYSKPGDSGCPIGYVDSQGNDHFMGSTLGGGTWENKVLDRNSPDFNQVPKTMVGLFNGQVVNQLEELKLRIQKAYKPQN